MSSPGTSLHSTLQSSALDQPSKVSSQVKSRSHRVARSSDIVQGSPIAFKGKSRLWGTAPLIDNLTRHLPASSASARCDHRAPGGVL